MRQNRQLTAGNNLTIKASEGDIRVQGSALQAGQDMLLNAKRDVLLASALNSQKLDGKNESHGSAYGVGLNFGCGANGISVNASVNKGKGSEKGTGTSHTETTLNAGNNLNIVSGRNTRLTGAQASGNSVKMDVGRNLQLTSEQDTDNYDAKQTSMSAGGSAGLGGGSLSLNASRDKMHSTYASVQEQTGIFAGKGGFDITVGEHTQLNGAVIGSTADAGKNKLDTGTLGFKDIENSAAYKVEHQSVGISSGGSVGSQFLGNMASGLLVGANGAGSASSTTKSAVSEGTIVIRDKEKQQQDVADLSRDAEHANQTLSPIFDKEKEQNRLREAQLIGEIGVQAGNIARTQGDLEGIKKAKADNPGLRAPGENASQKERDAYMAALRETDSYKETMKQYGTGSSLQQGIQAATAAIQGLAGGNVAQAITGAANPFIAEQIHKLTEGNPAAQAMAHAVVGAVVSYSAGNSALAGAAGAASGELMAQLVMKELYPGKDVSELTETEKQTISALGTLAAGLAGGVVGDSSANVVAGAQAGKNATENNALSPGNLIPPRVQQDASLAFDPNQQGKSAEEINDAVDASHLGPSWGTTYKVHPTGQVGADVSFIRGYTLNGTMDDNHISVSQGQIYSIGAHGSASIGLSFGPYYPDLIGPIDNDYSINAGLGVGSISLSVGKDGVGFSFGAGPSWGWSATEIKGVDVNGTSTNEVYRHDFK